MAQFSNPKIVLNGLVMYYDMNNTQKSWKGQPTVNLYTDPSFAAGSPHPVNGGGAVVADPRNSNNKVLKFSPSGGNQYNGRDIAVTLSSLYSYQMEMFVSGDFNGTNVMMYPEQGGSGAGVSYNLANKGTWQTLKYNGNAASTTNARMLAYVLSSFTTGYVMFTNVQVEQNAYATPFVNGTRSNTQAIIDLTNNNTPTATSLTYVSDGTFSFNGTSDRILVTNSAFNRTTGQEMTASCWIKPSRLGGQYNTLINCRTDAAYNWMLYMHATDGALSFHGSAQNKTTVIPAVNTWVHVTNTVTSAGVSTLYVNGVSSAVITGFTYNLTSPGQIGIGAWGTYTLESFQGSISNVNIYNRALSAAEVTQNFNALRGRYGI